MRRLLIFLCTITLSYGQLPPLPDPFPATTPEGYALPQPGHTFSFPRDHGSHPDFRIEWWYLTGHLQVDGTDRFGFQATFFRSAGAPPAQRFDEPDTAFGMDQLHLAHMAVIDLKTGEFRHQEKLHRAGWDAGAATDRLDVFQGNWSLRMTTPDVMELHGGVGAEVSFTLRLAAAKPLVVFGENSLSRKGAEPSAASYYLTYTRLDATGDLTLQGQTLAVTGSAWMDHEISSSQLGRGQVGWDWVSIQFSDARELMLYRLRLADGRSDPASKLTWIAKDGTLTKAPFTWKVLTTWTSPHTGATYPAKVEITTNDPATGEATTLIVTPRVDDQELPGTLGGIAYWEGACLIYDPAGNRLGRAYMELTGYTEALEF
ncbi:lipocalin-like domain-containing protein [Actomonas aquatica]|uniref:Lipocalin-like domain-containing protein n=1 Tax=Actomonas aquatica TaxID=2866162 RepID=A0ABZ1C7Y3_9BACT|nr:lipocalin-like domain-containing protein [Opitutus sp. WL0086]WRQ86649.1 lipocalin-like domain-containing protein [Opitutus sp. WL0086]